MEAPNAKPALRLKSRQFRESREKDWRALAQTIERAEKGQLKRFSTDELLNLPVLYRSAVSSLSMAQSISLDRNLVTYLQSLCARAYVFIYGPQARLGRVMSDFFLKALPQSFRNLWAELCLSLLCIVVGGIGGWMMCALDPSWYNALLGGSAQGRDVSSTADELRKTLGGNEEEAPLAVFSVFLMSNNIGVSLLAFAVGVIGGVPTAFVLIINGMMLGAMLWLFFEKGLGPDFVAWLSIHGTTEFLAIVISGAAGFYLARRLMFPGHLTRKAAMAEGGRTAGTLVLAAMLLLVVAGLLEGIGRQTITDLWGRLAIGIAMLTIWLSYFCLTGRKRPKTGSAANG